MRCAHLFGCWSRLGVAAVLMCGAVLGAARGVALATPAARARMPVTESPAVEPRVWDGQHLLSSPARETLERQLAAAADRAGVPFFVLVTDRLHGEPVADLAARIYAEKQLGVDPSRNVVLLVVAVTSGAAAIETGKGSAGIVPELDARRIVKELTANLSSHHPERALGQAVPALAAAARATAARRTPLPRPPPDPEPPVDAAPAESDQRADATAAGSPEDAESSSAVGEAPADAGPPGVTTAEPGHPARRSRVPLAAAIGVLVLVGLGLRRRRQITATRLEKPRRSDEKGGRRPF